MFNNAKYFIKDEVLHILVIECSSENVLPEKPKFEAYKVALSVLDISKVSIDPYRDLTLNCIYSTKVTNAITNMYKWDLEKAKCLCKSISSDMDLEPIFDIWSQSLKYW